MKFTKQRDTFKVSNVLDVIGEGCRAPKKHGALLPNSIRCIMCGPSGCGKTNLMHSLLTDINGLRFANLYIFTKSLNQPKYVLLSRVMQNVPEIGYFPYENSENVPGPEEVRPNSVFVFDDVACDSQDRIRAYFSMGRHKDVDCFYLIQTYTRVPKHLLRDNANMIIVFKQDEVNLKHLYQEHVNTDMSYSRFKEVCNLCWNSGKHNFLTICKDCELQSGRYRCGLDTFISDINDD